MVQMFWKVFYHPVFIDTFEQQDPIRALLSQWHTVLTHLYLGLISITITVQVIECDFVHYKCIHTRVLIKGCARSHVIVLFIPFVSLFVLLNFISCYSRFYLGLIF